MKTLDVMFRGEPVGPCEQKRIRDFVERRPNAKRIDLARGVCGLFGWRRPNGQPPLRGCAALLERLERMGALRLPGPSRERGARPPARSGTSGPQIDSQTVQEAPLDFSAPLDIRLIAETERQEWQAMMRRFHYVGDCPLVGESLRYVALLGSETAALIGWGAASLSNEFRDRFIGWDRETKARGLHQVVNNVRYLVLPRARQPNLASRILGANLRRLGADWEAVYGHRVLLAETFVDTSQFAGICYRASNWIYLGETKGFGKHGPRYSFHGRPKAVFVYPLRRRALELLRLPPSAFRAPTWADVQENTAMRTMRLEELPFDGEGGLFAVLGTITDPRMPRGLRHGLQSTLAVAVCATLAGSRTFSAISEWAADQSKEFLRRLGCWRGRAPSVRTFRRLLPALDLEEVDAKVGKWMAERKPLEGRAIALDGKTLCGSKDGVNGRTHLLSALVHGSAEVVAQTRVDVKTNEITRVEPLLENLDISGAVVTGDALLTQKNIARHIVEDKHADYVFTVKDNQPALREDIKYLFEAQREEAERQQRAGNKPPGTEVFPPRARDGR